MNDCPNRLLQELGEVAARFNRGVNDHSPGCCVVCRRALAGIIQALMDPANWQPEPVWKQLDSLRDQVNALQVRLQTPNGSPPAPPIPPTDLGSEPVGGFFEPPNSRFTPREEE